MADRKDTAEILKPVTYIYGTEDFIAGEALSAIKAAALTGGFDSMNLHVFEGAKATADEVVSAASTLPAFSPYRLIVVRNAEKLKAAVELELIPYIENPCPTTCLVFVSQEGKVDRGSPFFSLLAKNGFLRECSRLRDAELIQWIKKEAKSQGKEITPSATAKLLNAAGNRMRDIKGELERIILFALEKKTIEDSDVEDAGLDLREETVFGLSDAIGSRDMAKAMRIYNKVSGEDSLKVLGAISRQIRTLFRVKALAKKGVTGPRLSGALKVPPFAVEGYVRRSRLFTEGELREAVKQLYAADRDFKSGRVPESVVLPRLITELCSRGLAVTSANSA